MKNSRFLAVCFIWFFINLSAYGQHWLPVFVDFTGEDSDTLTWEDNLGRHFLLLETSDIIEGKEPGTHSQSVRVVHGLKEVENIREIWTFEDGQYDCPVEVRTVFRAAPRLSDLNQNGVYEVWFMIEKFCKGDASPSELRVIMFNENKQKYILEGTTQQVFADGSIYGGEYILKNFDSLPQEYQDFAIRYFKRNYKETF